MKKIKPFYSFVLVPDEKFKAKYKFNEYEKNFKKIKENILSFDHRLKRDYSLKIISSLFSNTAPKRKSSVLIEKQNYKRCPVKWASRRLRTSNYDLPVAAASACFRDAISSSFAARRSSCLASWSSCLASCSSLFIDLSLYPQNIEDIVLPYSSKRKILFQISTKILF